jgi:hypothetical protein
MTDLRSSVLAFLVGGNAISKELRIIWKCPMFFGTPSMNSIHYSDRVGIAMIQEVFYQWSHQDRWYRRKIVAMEMRGENW